MSDTGRQNERKEAAEEYANRSYSERRLIEDVRFTEVYSTTLFEYVIKVFSFVKKKLSDRKQAAEEPVCRSEDELKERHRRR
jgi:hypothetical protein|tara:strand:+ start:124 stop:369 length:246 start_codon:yes stop_codon:yes gene_type:complete